MGNHAFQRRLFNGVPINGTGSAESVAVDLRHTDTLEAFQYQVVSAGGAPDVKVEWALSQDGVTFNQYTDQSPIVASSAARATPEGMQFIALPAALARFIKFKVTGLATNPADSIFDGWLQCRELL